MPSLLISQPVSAIRSSAGKTAARLSAFCLGCLLLTTVGTAGGAESFAVDAARVGDGVAIKAHATVRAPLAVIWNTLLDYDHFADFIPGMDKSRLVEKHGQTDIIEQSGHAHLWLFTLPIEVTVETMEQPPYTIHVHLLKGNLKRLEGSYQIEKTGDDDTYVLSWSGIIEPGVSIPGVIAAPLMRKNISEQFRGMVDEIERRAAVQAHDATK